MFQSTGLADDANPWMSAEIISAQDGAPTLLAKEQIARQRAGLLLDAMTLEQKMAQLTGAMPGLLIELPECFGGRHVNGIPDLDIPTLRITNGPVGVGQNDCIARSVYDQVLAGELRFTAAYVHPTSAEATALPSALGVGASFDPEVATGFGEIIADEMNQLALHVFEAPGLNIARIPVLGRNFEYFGEDPYLTGTMGVAEIKAIQSQGLIGMAKHFVANEQETNRQQIREQINPQVLRELYLIPFEMAVKDGDVASLMCAYNYVNGTHSCESEALLTGVLRDDWGFTGYVQSDFFTVKSTVGPMVAGMDHEMPIPQFWSTTNMTAAMEAGDITIDHIDTALERRYTQMFKHGVFDRPIMQGEIDFERNGQKARELGASMAVLLQNNGALPFSPTVNKVVVMGKATQVYAQQAVAGGARVGVLIAGGSSDVVPHYTVAPVEGIKDVLSEFNNSSAAVQLVLVNDDNTSATIDGVAASFEEALALASGADAVVIMAGTISEEGADRLTTADGSTLSSSVVRLAPGANAADGQSLDWYVEGSLTVPATPVGPDAIVSNSHTVDMVKAVMGARSTTDKPMVRKTALVLKDNAGVTMDPALVGNNGPSILETWFPGQEDGHIVADLLFGRKNPSGKLPITFPYEGKSFLDNVTEKQYPGIVDTTGTTQTVEYTEGLHIGYRWYDSQKCSSRGGHNNCVAFPFGHGLSYTSFSMSRPRVQQDRDKFIVAATVKNTGNRTGEEVVQVYLDLPLTANMVGLPQPEKRLVGFSKVTLEPGRSTTVRIVVDEKASNHPLGVWHEDAHEWITPHGLYQVLVGTSSASCDLTKAGTFWR